MKSPEAKAMVHRSHGTPAKVGGSAGLPVSIGRYPSSNIPPPYYFR